jgi:Zn-dependent oligopeptidase
MAADAWMAFEETKDPWHAETASKFKTLILATGDAIDRAEAYRQFRGRDYVVINFADSSRTLELHTRLTEAREAKSDL